MIIKNTINSLSKAKQSKAKPTTILLTNFSFLQLFYRLFFLSDCYALQKTRGLNPLLYNLVKSFLISITFDNLSEKIKNLRLVINNKLFFKEDFKMKFKQITILLLSFIILLAISCGEAAYAPADGGGGLDSIPTASGTEATTSDLSLSGTYKGTIGDSVNRASYNSNPTEFATNSH